MGGAMLRSSVFRTVDFCTRHAWWVIIFAVALGTASENSDRHDRGDLAGSRRELSGWDRGRGRCEEGPTHAAKWRAHGDSWAGGRSSKDRRTVAPIDTQESRRFSVTSRRETSSDPDVFVMRDRS